MLQDLQEPGHITLLLQCLTLCVVQVRVHPYLVAAGQDLQEPGHHHLDDAVFDPLCCSGTQTILTLWNSN